jgi:putative tricarboxylic transport membrane protein
MIGTQAVATAPADGYTLLIAVSTHATNPALQVKVPYDGIKDFEPIAMLARTPVVLYAHPSFPATDLKSLIAIGKAKSHKLNFGSGGVGTMTHLVGEVLKIDADIEMLHIVYRGGTPALNDLLAGHLPLQFATVAQALPQYKAGQLRAIGISSDKRYPSVPEIPTFKEQGIDLVLANWRSVVAPPGITPEQRKTLSNAIESMVKSDAWKDILKQKGWDDAYLSGDAFADFLKKENARVTDVLKSVGLVKS